MGGWIAFVVLGIAVVIAIGSIIKAVWKVMR